MAMTFPSSPTLGQQYSVSGGPTYTWDGTVWKILTPGSQFSEQQFTATAGQTSFTVSGGYVIGAVDVYRNGVKLVVGVDFLATDLSTVVLTNAASAGDTIEVVKAAQILYADALKATNNLSDVGNAATALSNLGGVSNTSQLAGNRNKIINGAMMIDQRNAGASVTPTDGQYTIDRWQARQTTSSKYSVQQNAGSIAPPTGFTNYLGITSLSAYSVSATDIFQIGQQIEGFNISDLSWGTATAKSITLSFQVYSSLTGTFGGALSNGANGYSYPFNYSIPVANSWTSISITIPGPTSGVWTTNNASGIQVKIGLGVGSTYSGTAGSWAAVGYNSATGATSVVGTNGATFYITGVQLEKGATATPFENRLYGTELALCQRYCWNMNYAQGQAYVRFPMGFNTSTTAVVIGGIALPVTMRTNPTLTWSGGIQDLYGSSGATGNSVVIGSDTSNGSMMAIIGTYNSGTVVSGVAASFRINNSTTWYAIFTAEL